MKTLLSVLIPLLLLAGCSTQQIIQPEQVQEQDTEESAAPSPGAPKEGDGTQASPAPVVPEAPFKPISTLPPSAKDFAGCPTKPHKYKAIDLAVNGDLKFYNTIVDLEFDYVLRYYDWLGQESLKGKIPKDEELELIKKSGRKIALVFQHFNSSESTFKNSSRSATDVGHILSLAKKWGQPKGTTVFIGYDGDFPFSLIKSYATSVQKPLRAAGFKVGMYGSGGNCEDLFKAGLIDANKDGIPLCWIAASSYGWRGTTNILKKKKAYVLAQKVNQKCGGKSVDFNEVLGDFGAWTIP